jgi:CBS domain-containing protein
MKVREIMTSNVECLGPQASLIEVAQEMKSLDVGFMPICENDRLVGTVTDRDIVIRAVADGLDANTCRARDIMSRDIVYAFEDDDVKTVAEKMREKDVRRILILDKAKRLVGVVSIGDISKVEEKVSGKTLHDIAEAA